MKVHVILEFENVQDYQQTMSDIYDYLPLLVDWEEVDIFEEE